MTTRLQEMINSKLTGFDEERVQRWSEKEHYVLEQGHDGRSDIEQMQLILHMATAHGWTMEDAPDSLNIAEVLAAHDEKHHARRVLPAFAARAYAVLYAKLGLAVVWPYDEDVPAPTGPRPRQRQARHQL